MSSLSGAFLLCVWQEASGALPHHPIVMTLMIAYPICFRCSFAKHWHVDLRACNDLNLVQGLKS